MYIRLSVFYVHVCLCAHTKAAFPAFSLIDVTSPLPGREALMYNMLQFVSVPEYVCLCASLLNTRTHGHMRIQCVLVKKAVLALAHAAP